MKILVVITAWACLGIVAPAQLDPTENVKKILETIDEELEEIDRLLLETRRPSGGTERSSADQMRDLVKETQSSQERVVRGIDELIKQLEQMQQPNGSGSPDDQEQQDRQDQQQAQDQQRSQRQETEQQAQNQSEQQNQSQGQQQQAKQDQAKPENGRNTRAGSRADDAQSQHIRAEDRARWGHLPLYDLGRHSRGGLPDVPEKYRRLLEAYQKANQKSPRAPR